MKKVRAKIKNLLSDLISDDVYELLISHGFINEKLIRDYRIRTRFWQLRAANISAADAVSVLEKEYKSLNKETFKKIVYWKPGNDKGLLPGIKKEGNQSGDILYH